MICFDTNAAIALINGNERAKRHVSAAVDAGENLAVSTIVVFELRYGAEHSGRKEHNHARVDRFLAGPVDALMLDVADAAEAGRLREELASAGAPIGPYDVLIAGQARRRGASLATANRREFDRVPGLTVIDWARD